MTESFAVWAPNAHDVRLVLNGSEHDMRAARDGWWESDLAPQPGDRYAYQLLKSGKWSDALPDPRSRAQPEGTHGPSLIPESEFTWSDLDYTGRALSSMVIYELHVGTFTPDGTFDAAAARLDYLVDLGITAIELMPVQPFGGNRNWGYDGVLWHAVHSGYGGPESLKRFVDAAHQRGISVILDVVYNHFGPDGNYNNEFGPYTAEGSTGWGDVVNICGEYSDHVRAYILDAVRQWLVEFHIDGLRLDAVHAYDDRGAYSLMEEIQAVADDAQARDGRPRTIIAESDMNDPRLITERSAGGYGLAGQWVDDIHHSLHTMVTGETHSYYADYGTLDILGHTLRQGWRYNSTYSAFRRRTHGRPLNLEHTPAWRLVAYTTTHDQVGNRAAGDRPSMNLSAEQQVLKFAVIACLPFTPMLFMGEEFGARTPFPFFCSHTDEALNEATRQGRKAEFAHANWDAAVVPDPASVDTFRSAILDWDFDDDQARILDAYTTLLSLRRRLHLPSSDLRRLEVEWGDDDHRWLLFGSGSYRLIANLSAQEVSVPRGGSLVYSFTSPLVDSNHTRLGPWEFALIDER